MKNLDINKYILDIDVMDKHHKDFIEIFINLDFKNDETLMKDINSIILQTITHFSDEEELMEKYLYPRVTEHKEEHDKILYELKYFYNKANNPFGKKLLKSFCKERLPQWFEDHIISMDSDLAQVIKNKKME
ncbi:bacteriohemerythrin [Arcobacter sp. LA11]|uniref:bacteriohemerythrin n=1 Tax=Arcobacter sp. LA11 TaxID=1898176 RepID=UPI000934AE0D|nr:hemerythrin family protein [Arcobacter sp. LA11]